MPRVSGTYREKAEVFKYAAVSADVEWTRKCP